MRRIIAIALDLLLPAREGRRRFRDFNPNEPSQETCLKVFRL